MNQHIVFDTEIIGKEKPVFLVCTKCVETGERTAYWHHKRGHMKRLIAQFHRDDLTWVSFNGIHFDDALINAALCGYDVQTIKQIATMIIQDGLKHWDVRKVVRMEKLEYDHIDLIDVAPGVRTSLKTYAGRMHSPSMIDLPFHYDADLTPKQQKILEEYCLNDLDETERLFLELKEQIALRVHLGEQYDMDLRSKSDAQMAEAIFKKITGVSKNSGLRPTTVDYTAPKLIRTNNPVILDLISQVEAELFDIDASGAPIEAPWMRRPVALNDGVYKFGLGGLHSQHDVQLYREATDDWLISDFDVTSYYPNILMNCGLVPVMSGNKGDAFIAAYKDLYAQRVAAKRAGNKAVDKGLKIALNGTFGKLGSKYCAFYSPDLLIAITLTGQLNLLCVIDALEKHKGVKVLSANTDGIIVGYPLAKRDKVLQALATNTQRTGFGWEETSYRKVAMKDVNNYFAVTLDGKVKAKGLYSETSLMKNPTMQVCSDAAKQYLLDGTPPEKFIAKQKDIRAFLTVRNAKGGAEQGGVEIGRTPRWYMTTETLPPIRYVSNGNKVPKTDGARLCMKLPDAIPNDLDRTWYVQETYEILYDVGAYR